MLLDDEIPTPPPLSTVAVTLTPTDAARVEALRSYDVLDTPREDTFDTMTRLAAQLCDTPMAFLSLVDADRQWFKSGYGSSLREIPREHSFCHYALNNSDVLQVPDTRADPRFDGNPHVVGAPHFRFYAGAPLCTSDGHVLGTLCVFDRETRLLGDRELAGLADLAGLAMTSLEARRRVRRLTQDVTILTAAHADLVDEKRMLDGLVNNADACIYAKDLDGRIVMANPSVERLTRVDGGMVGRTDYEVYGQVTAAEFQRNDQHILDTRQPQIFTEELTDADGVTRIFRSAKFPVIDTSGELLGTAGISTDITELALARADLERIASTDPLTGALNRRAWAQRLDALGRRDSTEAADLVVAVIDVDHFKIFNDTHGHVRGDELLTGFATRAMSSLRHCDVFARWGGEEFIVALPDTDEQGAHAILDRIRLSVPAGQTCSIGHTLLRPGEDLGRAVARADEALYEAKNAGRNRICRR